MSKAIKSYKDPEKRKLYRNRQRKQNYNKTSYAKNHNKSYDELEDCLILEHLMTDTELSDLIDRSVQAIQLRRYRLKKQQEDKNNGN